MTNEEIQEMHKAVTHSLFDIGKRPMAVVKEGDNIKWE